MATPSSSTLARGKKLWAKIGKARAMKHVPLLKLRPDDLKCIADKDGNTVAHLLVASGFDKGHFKPLFTEDIYSLTNHAGMTPRAYRNAGPSRQAYLLGAAKTGDFSDFVLAATDFEYVSKTGDTILHTAARWGNLEKVPWPLTDVMLSVENHKGQTARDLAKMAPDWAPARRINDALYKSKGTQIPDLSALTAAQLMIPIGKHKKTLAHVLADLGALDQLPAHLLVYDILIQRGGWGYPSVYESARKSRCHTCVPPGLRSQLNEELEIVE